MPYTLNGFGTAYWGKAERIFRRNGCDHCGNVGDLASYDTTRYFVALFVPLVPLGKVRVFDECPSCHRHGAMKLRQWKRLQETEVEEALNAFRRQPTDAEAGCRLLQVCAAYGEETQFLETSKEVLQHHGGDANTLALVSEVLEEYGHLEQAEAALRRSLQAEESPERRRRLRWLMIRNGRPEEARPDLAFAYAEQDANTLPDLYLLVEGFQAQGQHQEALAELEAIEKAFPDEAETPAFQHLRQLSESRRQTGDAVLSPTLQPPRPPALDNDWSGNLARWGSPVLLLLLLGFGGWWIFNNGTRHPVYFVNGLDTAYSVEVDGRVVELPAGGHVVQRLPLGRSLSVYPAENAPPFEPFEVKFDLSFREGFSTKRIPVVNPDRAGVLLWETVDYLADDDPGRRAMEQESPPWEFHAGESVYTFTSIDYPFEDFPDQVEVPSKSSRARKARVIRMEVPPHFVWSLLQTAEAAPGSALGWITARVRLGLADDTVEPYMLASVAGREEFRSLAGENLAARPVKVDWHRAYQALFDAKGFDEELEEEYRRHLEADPQSRDWLYLMARVTRDQEARRRLFDKALAAPGTSPWPTFAAAIQELTEARFEAALELVQKALAADPESSSFQHAEHQAMLANGHFKALADRSQELRAGALDLETASQELVLLSAAGDTDEAESHQKMLLQDLVKEGADQSTRQAWQTRFQAARHLGAGDLEAYGTAIANVEDIPFPLHRALLAADAAAIEKALQELGEPAPEVLLLSHLACLDASPEAAARILDQAVAFLREASSDDRALAEMLAAQGSPADPNALMALSILPNLKAPALAILARRGGPAATKLRSRADELAYDPGFYGRLLRRLIG